MWEANQQELKKHIWQLHKYIFLQNPSPLQRHRMRPMQLLCRLSSPSLDVWALILGGEVAIAVLLCKWLENPPLWRGWKHFVEQSAQFFFNLFVQTQLLPLHSPSRLLPLLSFPCDLTWMIFFLVAYAGIRCLSSPWHCNCNSTKFASLLSTGRSGASLLTTFRFDSMGLKTVAKRGWSWNNNQQCLAMKGLPTFLLKELQNNKDVVIVYSPALVKGFELLIYSNPQIWQC